MDSDRFRFLYRQGEGTINRTEFWQASCPPVAVAAALMLSLFLIAPSKSNDLSLAGGIRVTAAFAYLMFCLFALFLCVISQYFVSAKRFADRGRPQALAGLAPFAIFLAGAANWYQPRSEGTMPDWATYIFDAAAVAIVIWTIVELGFIAGEAQAPKK
jgi:uncharacterized membrane protein YhaH (DUF805 family)